MDNKSHLCRKHGSPKNNQLNEEEISLLQE